MMPLLHCLPCSNSTNFDIVINNMSSLPVKGIWLNSHPSHCENYTMSIGALKCFISEYIFFAHFYELLLKNKIKFKCNIFE